MGTSAIPMIKAPSLTISNVYYMPDTSTEHFAQAGNFLT